MEIRENFQEIKLGDRKFKVTKVNARTGSYMLIKVGGILAPILSGFKGLNLKDLKDAKDINIDFSQVAKALMGLEEKDFHYIQDNCLRLCYEVLPGKLAPVLTDNNEFGVIGLDEDTASIMALTIHALIFNVKSFFSGSPLASLVGMSLNTFQQNSKI